MTISDTITAFWQLCWQNMTLANDEVHVWRVSLDQPQSRLRSLRETLAPDEQVKAERFYFQEDRDRFIVARAVLRAILGSYSGLDPSRLCFRYNSYGKPILSQGRINSDLRFNLSHSHELALLAVSRGRELGVDVESIRPELAAASIADRFFSPPEVAMLHALPAHLQTEAFFNCWTRKEAYIKARGEGLSLPLDKFDVSKAPPEPILILESTRSRRDSRWSLVELAPGAGYAAALVVEGRDWQLKCGQWPG
jgi:4'-phosphopantetheinyl transferase